MTDTPERIYAWVYHDGDRMHHNWSADATYGALQTEYVRADLVTPLTDPRYVSPIVAMEKTMVTNLLRFDFNERDGVFEVIENGDWVRATDYDALAAKLAEVEAKRDNRN